MDCIDVVLFINLDHRKDRLVHIEEQILKLGLNTARVHRIDAIRHSNGALGCGLSHIKALEFALENPDWNRIMILEDDFTFRDSSPQEHVRRLVTFDPNMNVCLLSGNPTQNFQIEDTADDLVKKVKYSQTTSGYVIQRAYLSTLISLFRQVTDEMSRVGRKHQLCIDIAWTQLQCHGGWYIFVPMIGYQIDGYSDIENCIVQYNC